MSTPAAPTPRNASFAVIGAGDFIAHNRQLFRPRGLSVFARNAARRRSFEPLAAEIEGSADRSIAYGAVRA